MTRQEFASVLAYVEACWPRQEIRDATAALWWSDLGELDQSTALAAVRSLYRAGREFQPNSAHILAEIAAQTVGAPDFGQAWALITTTISAHGSRNTQRVLDRLAARHCAVAELAAEIGVRQLGLAAEGDTTMHAQARERYASILRRHHRRHTHGDLPSAARRAIGRTAPAPVSGAIAQLVEDLSEDRT